MTNDEAISLLSDIRSEYNCFDASERPMYHALSMAIEALKAQPVHCKDCVYWKTGTVSKICTRGIITSIMNRGNDFCSYAERRTDDE